MGELSHAEILDLHRAIVSTRLSASCATLLVALNATGALADGAAPPAVSQSIHEQENQDGATNG